MKNTTQVTMVLSAAVLSLATTSACGPEEPDDVVCERQPPYHLDVSAAEGTLPSSTVVRVKHGGGQIDYPLESPPATAEVVFCDPLPAHGSPVASLSCELWTQGAITITVEADGYEPIEELATLERVDGCVVTQDISLELTLPED